MHPNLGKRKYTVYYKNKKLHFHASQNIDGKINLFWETLKQIETEWWIQCFSEKENWIKYNCIISRVLGTRWF